MPYWHILESDTGLKIENTILDLLTYWHILESDTGLKIENTILDLLPR